MLGLCMCSGSAYLGSAGAQVVDHGPQRGESEVEELESAVVSIDDMVVDVALHGIM